MALRCVQHAAPRHRHLTLDDVADWVQDAMRSGADGSETVTAGVSFGRKLQRLTTDIHAADKEPTP